MSRQLTHMRGVRRQAGLAGVAAALALGLAAGSAAAATPGRPDTTFGHGGTATAPAGVNLTASTVQPDGRVVAVGQDTRHGGVLALVRFTTRGALDSSFGSGGVVDGPALPGQAGGTTSGAAVTAQADGKLVVVGTAQFGYGAAMLVERFNANGTLDGSFGTHGTVQALGGTALGAGRAVAIQSDGRILASGSANTYGSGNASYPRAAIIRLNSNGSLDGGFGQGGVDVVDLGPYSVAAGLAVQPDGRIVIAGSQSANLQSTNALVARLTSKGALDTSFAGGHGVLVQQFSVGGASSAFNAVAVQSNGAIVAAGSAANGGASAQAIVVRLSAGGSLDGSFGSGGVARTLSATGYSGTGNVPGADSLAIAANGEILAGGLVANQSVTIGTVWAFTSRGALDAAFGNHGATTFAAASGVNSTETGVALAPDGSLVLTGAQSTVFPATVTGTVSRLSGYAPPVPKLSVSLKKLAGTIRLSTLSRHGLGFTLSCNQGCRIKVSLTVSAATARKLHLRVSHNRPVTLSSASATLRGAGSHGFALRLSRSLLRALGRQRRVGATLSISVTPTTGRGTSLTRKVTITR